MFIKIVRFIFTLIAIVDVVGGVVMALADRYDVATYYIALAILMIITIPKEEDR